MSKFNFTATGSDNGGAGGQMVWNIAKVKIGGKNKKKKIAKLEEELKKFRNQGSPEVTAEKPVDDVKKTRNDVADKVKKVETNPSTKPSSTEGGGGDAIPVEPAAKPENPASTADTDDKSSPKSTGSDKTTNKDEAGEPEPKKTSEGNGESDPADKTKETEAAKDAPNAEMEAKFKALEKKLEQLENDLKVKDEQMKAKDEELKHDRELIKQMTEKLTVREKEVEDLKQKRVEEMNNKAKEDRDTESKQIIEANYQEEQGEKQVNEDLRNAQQAEKWKISTPVSWAVRKVRGLFDKKYKYKKDLETYYNKRIIQVSEWYEVEKRKLDNPHNVLDGFNREHGYGQRIPLNMIPRLEYNRYRAECLMELRGKYYAELERVREERKNPNHRRKLLEANRQGYVGASERSIDQNVAQQNIGITDNDQSKGSTKAPENTDNQENASKSQSKGSDNNVDTGNHHEVVEIDMIDKSDLEEINGTLFGPIQKEVNENYRKDLDDIALDNMTEEQAKLSKEKVELKKRQELVKRNSNVLEIGDLGGSLLVLLNGLRKLDLISMEGKEGKVAKFSDIFNRISWKGGDQRLVLAGDILGDRVTQSVPCMAIINKLSKEAEHAGGQISVLAGNHDSFIMTFLSEQSTDEERAQAFSNCFKNDQGIGLMEIIRIFYKDKEAKILEGFETLNKHLGINLSHPSSIKVIKEFSLKLASDIRNSKAGKELLGWMANMKLCENIDDTLFIHTSPTDKIMDRFVNFGKTAAPEAVKAINEIFQKGLRANLFGAGLDSVHKDYKALFNTFLNTENRIIGRKYLSALPSKMGVNRILYGHNGTPEAEVIDGVEVGCIDKGVAKIGLNGLTEVQNNF